MTFLLGAYGAGLAQHRFWWKVLDAWDLRLNRPHVQRGKRTLPQSIRRPPFGETLLLLKTAWIAHGEFTQLSREVDWSGGY